MWQAKRRTTEIRPGRRRRHFRLFFSNFDKYRPEVPDDFISTVAVVEWVGMDVRLKFGNSTLSRGLIILRLVTGFGHVFLTYTQYSTAVCSRPDTAVHLDIWHVHVTVPDKCIQFLGRRLNCYE